MARAAPEVTVSDPWNVAARAGVSLGMSARSLAVLLLFLSSAARAVGQTPPPTSTPAPPDTVPHRLSIDPSKVQLARSTYRLLVTRDTTTSLIGEQQFAVTTLDYAGTQAFLLARSGTQGVTITTDSLVVRRDDLRPLHWIASQGVAHVAIEFTADTIFGAMTSPLGKQNLVLPNRADLLVSVMAVDAVMSALPLSMGKRDSAAMLVIDAGGATITTASIEVEGEERITVPAGDFDCWIVSLETERASGRFWVTKEGQVVVRSEQLLPELDGAALTRLLIQTDSPSLVPVSARLPQ